MKPSATSSLSTLSIAWVAGFCGSCATTHDHHCSPGQRHDLEGRSLTAVVREFGSDIVYDQTRRASELRGEFYTPINARFPLNNSESRNILIRELRWEREDHYIAVFSRRERGAWLVIDAVEWPKRSWY